MVRIARVLINFFNVQFSIHRHVTDKSSREDRLCPLVPQLIPPLCSKLCCACMQCLEFRVLWESTQQLLQACHSLRARARVCVLAWRVKKGFTRPLCVCVCVSLSIIHTHTHQHPLPTHHELRLQLLCRRKHSPVLSVPHEFVQTFVASQPGSSAARRHAGVSHWPMSVCLCVCTPFRCPQPRGGGTKRRLIRSAFAHHGKSTAHTGSSQPNMSTT